MPLTKELKVEAKIENIPQIISFVDEFLDSIDCPMKAHMQINMVIDDLFANVAYYAYPNGDGYMTIILEQIEGGIKIYRIDTGVPYNPLLQKDPDITSKVEDRQIGGLGTYLVKNLTDSMDYEYKDKKNIVIITKLF